MAHASGTFDVKSSPEGTPETVGGISFSRWTFDKQFNGGLHATSTVEMLAAGTDDLQAGAYVALERVTGELDGRPGTFVLMHVGVAGADAQRLTVEVAPGLSTGELSGLSGTMAISADGDDHRYELEYTLAG